MGKSWRSTTFESFVLMVQQHARRIKSHAVTSALGRSIARQRVAIVILRKGTTTTTPARREAPINAFLKSTMENTLLLDLFRGLAQSAIVVLIAVVSSTNSDALHRRWCEHAQVWHAKKRMLL